MKNKRRWIHWEGGSCPNCGNDTEVCTDAEQDHIFPVCYDGDPVKCVECKWEASMMVDENGAKPDDGNLEELENQPPQP